MEAARETILELGYAGATTSEIVRRAGVSRGAQVHHYATKQQLMLAVADFILSDVECVLEEITEQLRERPGEVDDFIFDIWEKIFAPSNYHPMLELVTASRTDEVLRRRLAERWTRLLAAYDDIWSRVFSPPGRIGEDSRTTLDLTLFLLRGMAFQRVVLDNDPEMTDRLIRKWSSFVHQDVALREDSAA